MKVSLNLKPCPVPDGLETFIDLLNYVERERIPSGQVLTRIVLDGTELDEEQERAEYSHLLSQLEVVEFYSARTLDLAREGLSDATELLPSLAEDLPVVASELRVGKLSEALTNFAKCVEVLSWYVGLITALDAIFRPADPAFRLDPAGAQVSEELTPEEDLTAVTAEEGPELRTFASVENLRQKLIDIESAQDENNTLLLADLIEYELLPIVEIWAGEVPVLLAKVNREGGTA